MNSTGMHIEEANVRIDVISSSKPKENILTCIDLIDKDITQHVEDRSSVAAAQLQQGIKKKRRRKKIATAECCTQTDEVNLISKEITEFGTQTEKRIHRVKNREKESQEKKDEIRERLEKIIGKIEARHKTT